MRDTCVVPSCDNLCFQIRKNGRVYDYLYCYKHYVPVEKRKIYQKRTNDKTGKIRRERYKLKLHMTSQT